MHKEKQKKLNRTKPEKVIVKMKKGLSVVNPHAAGIDIADQEHWVAIHKEDSYHVSRYGTFTRDLDSMVSYLKDNGITTVAIEATGVYYVCLFIKLEEAGIEPYLVNAKHVKNVTGRKQDDTDAIWMQKLHACGLLQKSFQPGFECRTLRSYVRHRKNLVTIGSDSVRRMQKALELMNIKIHTVISDILGKTGQQMIEAIIGGQHDPAELIKYKDRRVKASDEVIIKSLEGIWKEEHLFELKQAYETYQFHQKQIQECDIKIKDQLDKQTAIVKEGEILNEQDKISFNKQKGGKGKGKKTAKKNQYTFDARSYLRKLLDTDICAVPGISDITALEVIAEIGGDVNAWARVNQFTRWLNVSPNTKSSGGKILSSKIMKKKNYAGLSLRMSAMTMARNKTPLGDYYRRMRGKLGGRGAVVATANKIARIIYTMIKHKKEYDISMFKEAQQNYKTRQIKFYEKKIAELKKAS